MEVRYIMGDIDKKINFSNKIYPIYCGLSSDLVVFISINTIFFTSVKHFSAIQINFLTTCSVLITIFLSLFILKIVKKIGDLNSVKLGNFMLLISSLLITFCNNYFLVLLGEVFYSSSFLFKSMDSVILRKNLKYLNRLDDYIKYQNKSTFIYAVVTMIVSFLSGFLFNINQYLPMIICILFCINNCVLCNFLYEVEVNNSEELVEINKFKFTKIILYILLFYAIFYSCVELSQTNTKLLLQYNMNTFLNEDKVVICFSIIIVLSRIMRIFSNVLFNKFYSKLENKLLIIINFLLILSYIFILIGNFINGGFLGISIMTLGFTIFLMLRDPIENYSRTILLNNCDELYHEQVMVYFVLFRRIFNFVISLLITGILLKFDLRVVSLFLLFISICSIFLVRKIYCLLRK